MVLGSSVHTVPLLRALPRHTRRGSLVRPEARGYAGRPHGEQQLRVFPFLSRFRFQAESVRRHGDVDGFRRRRLVRILEGQGAAQERSRAHAQLLHVKSRGEDPDAGMISGVCLPCLFEGGSRSVKIRPGPFSYAGENETVCRAGHGPAAKRRFPMDIRPLDPCSA